MYFKTLSISSLFALAALIQDAVANPVASRDSCVTLASGHYTITLAQNGWQLRPFHHAQSSPGITSAQTAPTGQLGVWSITHSADATYTLGNVGEGSVVATLNIGGNPQPYTTTSSLVGPVQFAIQCAGGGTYVIKNPSADSVWTAAVNPGVTNLVKMIGANGDISQRFLFHPA